MTILTQTIARLVANKEASGLKLIEGAAEFAALQGNPPLHLQPAAYVLPTSDRAERSELIGKHRQLITRGVAVVLGLGNLRDPRGEGATAAIEALEATVSAELAGWLPTGAVDAMQFSGSRLLGLRDQVVWRQLDFTVRTKLQP